jgi:PAS domain S-box-containing protein
MKLTARFRRLRLGYGVFFGVTTLAGSTVLLLIQRQVENASDWDLWLVGMMGLGMLAWWGIPLRRHTPSRQGSEIRNDLRWCKALADVSDGVAMLDFHSGITWYSPSWATLLGYSNGEYQDNLQDAWRSRVHPDDRVRIEDCCCRIRTGESRSCRSEYRVRMKHGSYKWVQDVVFGIDAATGAGASRAIIQRVDVDASREAERTVYWLSRVDLPDEAQALLQQMVRYLAAELDVAVALIGMLDQHSQEVKAVAGVRDGMVFTPPRYPLAGTPCERAVETGFCLHLEGVAELYPSDVMLKAEGLTSYAGIPLLSTGGQALGILVILDRKPMERRAAIEATVRLCATRAASEIRRLEAAEALRNRDRVIETLFHSMPAISSVKDVSGRYLAVNDEFSRFTSLSQADVIGFTPAQLFDKQTADLICHADRMALGNEGLTRCQETFVIGGKRYELVTSKFPLRDSFGSAYAIASISVDITEQVQQQRSLKESEEKLRTLFDCARDAILVLDADGICVDCNESAIQLFVTRRHEIEGKRFSDFAPELQPTGESSLGMGRRVIRSVLGGAPQLFEWRACRLDGEALDCEVSLNSLRWGGELHLLAIVRDVSERRAEREELELLHAASNATPVGILVTDLEGRIQWTNAALSQMTGYAPAELVGMHSRDLKSGQHNDAFYRSLWETVLRGDVWTGELTNKRKDGTCYLERMTIASVSTTDGNRRGFVAVKEDITKERRLEESFSRAQRLESIGLLASGLAHDLNNVLTPIILSIELLDGSVQDERIRDRLSTISTAAVRGANIVKQVLTFARGVDGERSIIRPAQVLKEVAQLARETFPRQIEVVLATRTETANVEADVTQLHRVLLNLAINARDAMPNGGKLTLGICNSAVGANRAKVLGRIDPGDFVEISVSDTGTGISRDVLEHLFEPFYTTKPRGRGTGLGLSSAYGIVRSHGGAIEVQTDVGKGTTFRVLLPAILGTKDQGSSPPWSLPIIGEGRRVLVVDDELPIRSCAADILTMMGFVVSTAADGVEALEIFLEKPDSFALAIVDHMMPRMGGLELISELKKIAPRLGVISSTGLGAEHDAEKGDLEILRGLGVRTRLPKPYTPQDLVAALGQEIRSSRAS